MPELLVTEAYSSLFSSSLPSSASSPRSSFSDEVEHTTLATRLTETAIHEESTSPIRLINNKNESQTESRGVGISSPKRGTMTEVKAPWHSAASDGNIEVIRWFIDKGIDLEAQDDNNKTALHIAAEMGHTEVVKLLVGQGALVGAGTKSDGVTPLHLANRGGNIEVTQFLIDQGARVTKSDIKGALPMHYAAEGGDVETLNFLAYHGSTGVESSVDGSTPLHVAAANSRLEAVRWFLDRGANINASNSSGKTSMHLAASKGHVEVLKILIDRGADIHVTSNDGSTALGFASREGHKETVELLINRGANVMESNAIHSARFRGHVDVVRLLYDRRTAALINGGKIQPTTTMFRNSPYVPFPGKLTCSLPITSRLSDTHFLGDEVNSKLYQIRFHSWSDRLVLALHAGSSKNDATLVECHSTMSPTSISQNLHYVAFMAPTPARAGTYNKPYSRQVVKLDFAPNSQSVKCCFAMERGERRGGSPLEMEHYEWRIVIGHDKEDTGFPYIFELRNCSPSRVKGIAKGNETVAQDETQEVISVVVFTKNKWTRTYKLEWRFLTPLEDHAAIMTITTALLLFDHGFYYSKTRIRDALGYKN